MDQALDAVRKPIRSVIGALARFLDKLTRGKLTPDMVTWAGFVAHGGIALLITQGFTIWAAVFLVIFGLFDTLDGQLAHVQKRVSITGMLLDSITDRMKEILLYVAIAYAVIATTGRPFLAVWAVAACGTSLLVSYVNSWGEAVAARYKIDKHTVNKSFRGGLLPFEVRMALVFVGLVTNRLALLSIVITIGASYTALARLRRIFRNLRNANIHV